MTDFALSENIIADPEELLRKNRPCTSSSLATTSTFEPVIAAPSDLNSMAHKSLREFSILAVANVPTRPVVNVGDKNFELRTELITMVQASPFCGLPNEDANAHLQHFLELCDTIVIKDVTAAVIRL